MSSDNQFTAFGPTAVGFQTDGTNIAKGANIAGTEVGVRGECKNGNGVEGFSQGQGVGGVFGSNASESGVAFGVIGSCNSAEGAGVSGRNNNGDAVSGFSSRGVAIKGTSEFNDAIVGICDTNDKSGVFGFNGSPNGVAFGVFGSCNSLEGAGVSGRNDNGDAVSGLSSIGAGIRGISEYNDAVVGTSNAGGKSGVYGYNTHPSESDVATFGVSGTTLSANGAGVNGFSAAGVGTCGSSQSNDGVVGQSQAENKSGVFGLNTQTQGLAFGISGSSVSPGGAGVCGFSDNGYGGQFRGGRAPLFLIPATATGHPATGFHQRGELFVDSTGDLYYCKDSGIPGNWFKVQLIPA